MMGAFRPLQESVMSDNELTPTPHDVQFTVATRDGQPAQGLIAFTGRTRDALIASLTNSLAATGKYTPDARAVSSQVLGSTASTVTAVASTVASATIAPTLFMATANPATLMQLGSGVGSAVMGASGIAAQAPFIPVAAYPTRAWPPRSARPGAWGSSRSGCRPGPPRRWMRWGECRPWGSALRSR